MAEPKAESRKNQDSRQNLWKFKKEKSIKDSIFEFYCRLFNRTRNQEDSVTRQKLIIAIEGTIWCLQVISLLYVPDMPITNWKNNMIIWEVIGHIKIDNTCSALGIIDECFFILLSFTYASFTSVIILVIAIYYSYSLPSQVFTILYYLFYLWSIFFLIPSIEIFSLFFKYNFLSQNKISEYEDGKQLADFEVGSIWKITIIFLLIFGFILYLFYTEFSAEIRHSAIEKNLNAKAHSRIDTHIAIFTYIFPIAFALFAKDHIIYLQILAIFFSMILLKETANLLPYFSIFCNTVIILRLCFIALFSFIFILGRLMDNSLAISLLLIILGPLSSVFIIQFSIKLQTKPNKDIPENLNKINSQYDLEKSIRHELCSNSTAHKDEIIKIFENFFIEKRLNGNKLQAIWAANYCYFTLQDESLAKIKLAKTKYIPDSGLESNYQEYLCHKNILEACASQSSQFSNYFLQFHTIKKADQKLCINLFNFWNEITSTKPDLTKLKKSLSRINNEISELNSNYHQIFTKFPNSRESLALYVSYTKDITYEYEKSNLIEVKLRAIERSQSNPINNSSNFSYFNDNNGVLVISNEPSNFGEILFANPKSSEIFKLPLKNIASDNFFNFIDPYYKERVREKSKQFIQFSSVSEIDLSQGFFLTVRNNLLDCTGKLWATSINSLLVAILVFKPKENSHQFALVSESGEIIRYSRNFAKILRKSDENLIGCKLKKLFFKSENFEWKLDFPYHIKQNFGEYLLILSLYEIYNIKIPYIILINDSEEIFKWQNSNKPAQNDQEKLEVATNKLSVNFAECDTFRTISSYHKENQRDEDLDSKMNLFTDEDAKNSSDQQDAKSQVSVTAIQHKFLNMVHSSARSINILHLAFVFSIITVLAVNIAVLAYAFADIKFISDMNLLVNIGKAGKNFQRIALYAQILLIVPSLQIENGDLLIIASVEKYVQALSELETVYSSIISNSRNWNACSSQSILGEDKMNLWSTEDWTAREKANLIDTISMFIKNGNEFERKLADPSENPWSVYRFLLLNGWGVALDYCNQSLIDIIECQESMMIEFKSQMIILLILGPAVLIACILMILPFYYSIFKIENILWNNIRKNAFNSYSELKQTILERLKEVHAKSENLFSYQNPSMEPYIFKSYWRYSWRILAYLAAVILFCLINTTYLYEECSQYLMDRPEVLKDLIQNQILYTTAAVWGQQMSGETYGLGLWLQFPFATPFSRSTPIINSTIISIENKKLALRNSKFSSILSDNFRRLFYENNNGVCPYFDLGVYAAQELWRFDIYTLAYGNSNPQFWVDFMDNLQHIDEFYTSAIDEIDKYSQSVIDDQMKIITISLISFIMCSFVAYFGFYLLFFRNEKKYMQKINAILKIIPSK
ncbi:unnamed protein product [Blepharisma stoltei]|uniref:TmcB/TmcC TPR repeats domain-containing protein n=1 Tax=Blepharisma stoltei TaxID=1481888 RepID=A0AAU9I7S6_9CILI|nr:unnamed protein product [Blepharisma stoltei]